MKEASGEANMTIVTIILIGIIVAVVTPLINGMMQNTKDKATCASQGLCDHNGDGTCEQCSTVQ